MSRSGRRVVRFLVLLFAIAPAGCGYSLAGRGSSLPTYIQIVGIPLFENDTSVFEVEQVLTQHVRQEFIGRGRYKVVPESTGVDALLTGRITNISISPSGFTSDRVVSRYTLNVTASIEFRDVKADTVLWQNPSLAFTEEYEVSTSSPSSDANAFFGQQGGAVQRVAQDFARAVVSSIMEAF